MIAPVMKLSDFKALTFDVYGTLIDWETGMITALRPLISRAGRRLSSDAVLEAHAFHESALQRWAPTKRYGELLALVYRRLAEEWGVEVTAEECRAYGLSVSEWPAFEDSRAALAYLKRHFKLYVLTNTDNRSFAASNDRLGITFDGAFTAEDIGSYKPNPRNFAYMLEALGRQGIEPADILHTAESMFHDHAPANACGLANCWIHRRHAKSGFGATMKPAAMPNYDFKFNSLNDMVAAHRAGLT